MIVSLIFNFQFSISKQFLISKFSIFKLGFQFFVIVLSIAAIFFARSEGALIGLLLAFSFMFLFWVFLRFAFRLVYLKLIGVLIFVFVLLSPFVYLKLIPEHKYFNFESPVLNYITDKTMLKDFSGEVRKQQWRETMEFLTGSPKNFIFGAGLSGFQSAVEPYHSEGIFFNSERDEDFRRKIVLFDEKYKAAHWRPVEIYMYPHSLVLNFWVELGLAGMLLFIWILLKIYILEITKCPLGRNYNLEINDKRINYTRIGLIGAFIVIIVHGLVDVPYFKNDLAVLFWVMVAMLGMLGIENKKLNDE
jgi:O-antigen ligase